MNLRPLLFLFSLISSANAGLITIPLEDKEQKLAPASDLVYQGARINEVEALELEKSGIDLSLLDPYESDLFQPNSTKQEVRPPAVTEVAFHSILQAPTEFFRFASKADGKSYTVTASLFNHETMVRSSLLRKVGFNVPAISYQHQLKIYFDSTAALDLFLEKLVDKTLLSKNRWLVEENKSERYLRIRGLILEPADSRSVPVYWPVMEETRQRKRRVFRSLLYLYALTDFNMPVNEVSWSLGKTFNNELVLSHHFSDDFSSVSIADLKWFHRRIASLREEELCQGLSEANYPADVAELLCEKLKSRINSLGNALGLSSSLRVNEYVGGGQVRNGKLTSGEYPDFVPVFWIEDAESPYRFSEVFKFFRTQVAYDTVSTLLDTAERSYLPNISTSDAYEEIMQKVQSFGRQNGSVPLRVWTTPTASGSVGGNRSIVFGKYDGNDAPIQLVDSLSMRFQVGLFSYLSGTGAGIIPTGGLKAQIVRNWSHIKAMPDLSTATKQKVVKLLIPRLYKSLGQLLENDPQCSLQDDAWVAEEIIAGFGVWVVYYDQSSEAAKASALKLREGLINNGTPKNKILLKPVLRDELCLKEITEKRNKSVEEFLKNFAMDETLTITDSLETSVELGAKLSDGVVDGLKLQAGLEGGRTILRSYIFRKTESGIEITIRNQKNFSARFYQEMKFFVNLLANSMDWVNGGLHSKVYRINFDDADDEQKKIAVGVLREVLLRSSYGQLVDNYNPIVMDHEAKVKLHTFKFLWRKSESLGMTHEVDVVVPNRLTTREIPQEVTVDEWTAPVQPEPNLSESERTRRLFSTMSLFRRGNNYHDLLNSIVNDQFSWLSTGAQDGDPGQSIRGNSFHAYVTTEGDLSPGYEFNPVTRVEYGNRGWSLSAQKLETFLSFHEDYLSTTDKQFTLDRSIFNQTSVLRSYDIRTTLILYPAATQKLLAALMEADEDSSLALLKSWYGEKEWERQCRGSVPHDGPIYYAASVCVPRKLMGILKMRQAGIPKRKQDLGIKINALVQILVANVQKKALLSWLGKENYFGSTFISGFRNGDAIGFVQYASDTVGTYNKDLATGIFDQLAGLLGVKAYNLKGMVYTPNM